MVGCTGGQRSFRRAGWRPVRPLTGCRRVERRRKACPRTPGVSRSWVLRGRQVRDPSRHRAMVLDSSRGGAAGHSLSHAEKELALHADRQRRQLAEQDAPHHDLIGSRYWTYRIEGSILPADPRGPRGALTSEFNGQRGRRSVVGASAAARRTRTGAPPAAVSHESALPLPAAVRAAIRSCPSPPPDCPTSDRLRPSSSKISQRTVVQRST